MRSSHLLSATTFMLFAVAFAGACNGDPTRDGRADSTSVATIDSSFTCNSHIISGDGIGVLRIGAPFEFVKQECEVTSDTLMRGNEGQPVRVLSIAIGLDTPYVEVVNGQVTRILVRSQGIYTRDSLSVGSSVEFLKSLPDLQPIVGEGYLYVTSSAHCGIRFRLSEPPSTAPNWEWTTNDLRQLSPMVHVTRILIGGCDDRRP